MTAGLLTLGPVVSLAVARAARGLPPAGPDRSIDPGDAVRVRWADGSCSGGTVTAREADGRLRVACGNGSLILPRHQVERLAPLAPGDLFRHLPTARLGRVETVDGHSIGLVFYDGLLPHRLFAHRVDLDPAPRPRAATEGAGSEPEPPEAA